MSNEKIVHKNPRRELVVLLLLLLFCFVLLAEYKIPLKGHERLQGSQQNFTKRQNFPRNTPCLNQVSGFSN